MAPALVAGLLAAGCATGEPLQLPGPTAASSAAPATPGAGTPAGQVVVAYPDVPASWHGVAGDDPAATDLAALWGLPLYRYGPDGALRGGLVEDGVVGSDDQAWWVDLSLRPGRWSDGQPVTAADVVATVEGLRTGPREPEFAVLEAAEVLDDATVRLTFREPYPRWPHLLSGGVGVLPAHVLAERGIEAYEQAVPVAGGWFRLESFEPGLRAVFVAHPGGPLGPPGVERVEVLFTPAFETALGLLDDRRVDVVVGHLALDPVGRAERLVEGVEAAAPLGGTVVSLEWVDDRVESEVRGAVSDVIDLGPLVEGLLGDVGELASSPWPGVDGPWTRGRSVPAERQIGTLRLLVPRWHEVTVFTARAIQGDLGRLEGTLEIVREETPGFVASAREDADVVLRIRRDAPRPSLARMVTAVTPEIRAADAVSFATDPAVAAAFEEVAAQASLRPLYRVGVAHVWRDQVRGVRPSSWPGAGLWNVGEWALGDG